MRCLFCRDFVLLKENLRDELSMHFREIFQIREFNVLFFLHIKEFTFRSVVCILLMFF